MLKELPTPRPSRLVRENSEERDTDSAEDHSSSTTTKTPFSSEPSETFLVLKLAMSTDLTLDNWLQVVTSEDSLSGLNLPSNPLIRSSAHTENLAKKKGGYHLHRTSLTNPDIAKIINSDAVQSVVRNRKENRPLHSKQKKNPLKNTVAMERLNPHSNVLARMDKQANENNKQRRELAIKAKRGFSKSKAPEEKKEHKQRKQVSRAFMSNIHKNLNDAYKKKEDAAE